MLGVPGRYSIFIGQPEGDRSLGVGVLVALGRSLSRSLPLSLFIFLSLEARLLACSTTAVVLRLTYLTAAVSGTTSKVSHAKHVQGMIMDILESERTGRCAQRACTNDRGKGSDKQA